MVERIASKKAKLLFILMALFMLSMPTTSQTNNCCSIDRQCNTDEQWIRGWWAFQHNQCGAAVDSQQQQQPERQTRSPSQINNCCFTGWQCDADEDWKSGYFAFQHNQCASQSQWEEQSRNRGNSNRQPQGRNRSPQQQERQWGTVSAPIDISNHETQVYYLDDGTPVQVIRVTHNHMCAWFPFLDYCQYPENYPEIWEDDEDDQDDQDE
ncbi:MAG: hypothetical protein OXG60_05625 [Chloroflexi bacterium]|nr:hypothetical protein [Chloroflexota bacterium]